MLTHRATYMLLIVALWSAIAVLALFTPLAIVASAARSDCTNGSSNNSLITVHVATNVCNFHENISYAIHHHSSYFQSAHIIIIRLIASLSLLVFKPSVTTMLWSTLEGSTWSPKRTRVPVMRMGAFQSGVDLASSAALVPAVLYTKASRSLTPQVTFVLLVSILSLLSPLAVSPIYRSHVGPYDVFGSIIVGGGIGLVELSPSLLVQSPIPRAVSSGVALLNAGTALNIRVFPNVFDISVAPFIPMGSIEAIWSAEIKTVVARNLLDCSSSAPARLLNSSSEKIVSINESLYFAPDEELTSSTPSFAGQVLGSLTNDPQVTAVYLDSSVTVVPGSVEAQASVIFCAANGTLEGAQQTITSPDPTSRIVSVDVLACTSTTKLETSVCIIEQGAVTSCNAFVPANAVNSSMGGIDAYIYNPASVAAFLAVSPVTAYYSLGNRLPTYTQIGDGFIASQTLPTSDLTIDLRLFDQYHVSLSYITDTLFAQTAQGLVQGILLDYSIMETYRISLTATFGTSKPLLPYVVLALSVTCALTATIAGALPRSSRNAAILDVAKLLAISRNVQLDDTFGPYADRNTEIDDDLLDRRIGYGWVEELNGKALVIDSYENCSRGLQEGKYV